VGEATFTFRVDEALKGAFAQAAKAHDRTGAQLIRDFMRDYVAGQRDAVEHDAWFRRQVQIGLDSANAGRLVPDDEVEAEAEAWRTETRRRMADRT
jgi:predicted transcriptional regulator